MDEQDKLVDAETKRYLDTLQSNITEQINGIKELFQSKLDPTVESTRNNTKDIKDHSTEINELKVEITALQGSVRILEDNKQSQKDKDSLEPKNRGNIIKIIAICITVFTTILGATYILATKVG